MKVIDSDKLPPDEHFTFSNAHFSWVTGIFVDIRDSTSIFSKENQEMVAKVIRAFTSEVIEIFRDDDNLREIGIRGDCVYAIYTTPKKSDISEIMDMSFYVNTLMKLLNKEYRKRNFPEIEVGIGIGTAKELVVKAGRKDTGINNKVWIGKAVTKASKLSSFGSKDGYQPIVISSLTYSNIIEDFVQRNGENAKTWFNERNDSNLGVFYDCSIIKTDFNNWIDQHD
jgi:class 3 adenylate cyclase